MLSAPPAPRPGPLRISGLRTGRRISSRRRGSLCTLGVLALLASPLAPSPAQTQDSLLPATVEERTARYFDAIRDRHPLLVAFIRAMPKGGDLHSHLSGAVYAESYIRWAAEDGLCLRRETMALVAPPCDAEAGRPPVREAAQSADLYGEMVDAWSLRNWHPARETGHAQFFDSFGKFGAASGRTGEMLAEVAARAAAGGVSYLELMLTPDGGGASGMGRRAGYDPDLRRFRERLLAEGLRDTLAAAGVRLVREEERQREVLRCGTPLADAGCGVVVRYLYQVGRARTPEQVFAQILAGFEMASSDPRIVGFNLVQPEDNPVAMRDYSMQMGMIDFLHDLYPLVKITLHAGELAPGLVPPEGLRFHIREAIERGHASRIGHGVDVMHEDRPLELLEEMARRGVLVEIALSSNDVILGVRGPRHPLSAYMHYGVPVALATDDEGVSRSEMSMEYLKAAEEQGVGYSALKRMARNSLEYAFVEGESLWSDRRAFTLRGECVAAGGGLQSSACAALAERSTKARLQLELERAFGIFESEYAAIEATGTVRGR